MVSLNFVAFKRFQHRYLICFIAASALLHSILIFHKTTKPDIVQYGSPLSIRTSKSIPKKSIKSKKQIEEKISEVLADAIGLKKYEEKIQEVEASETNELPEVYEVSELEKDIEYDESDFEAEDLEPNVDPEQIQTFTKGLQKLLNQYLSRIDLRKYYPRSAIRRNIEGNVFIKLIFNKSGELIDIKLDKSSRHSSLDKSAMKLVDDHKNRIIEQLKKENWPIAKKSQQYSVIAQIGFEMLR